ncbi:MAG: hypothetical protein M3011_13535, partial [Actinomycetota bacterium]|nr:hypothetical protein [Actinomycetota bacterium]
ILGNPPLIIPRSSWDRSLRTSQWGSFGVQLASGIAAGVGVALILLQVIRRQPVRLALRSRPGQHIWVSRKGLGHRLTHDVSALEEIAGTKVRVGRNRVRTRIEVASGADRAAGVAKARTVIQGTLRTIGVVHELSVRVAARSTESSGARIQ